jgi:hypothetical protein
MRNKQPARAPTRAGFFVILIGKIFSRTTRPAAALDFGQFSGAARVSSAPWQSSPCKNLTLRPFALRLKTKIAG